MRTLARMVLEEEGRDEVPDWLHYIAGLRLEDPVENLAWQVTGIAFQFMADTVGYPALRAFVEAE